MVTLFFKINKKIISRIIETYVTFREITLPEIHAYINTQEPFDKAGGYGIQGKAMGFVLKVEGSYTNVIGLPLAEVLIDLKTTAILKHFIIYDKLVRKHKGMSTLIKNNLINIKKTIKRNSFKIQ